MSMHEVNLVPKAVLDRVTTGRASRLVTAVAIVFGASAVGVAAVARTIDARSQAQLAAARDSSAPVIALESTIESIRRERAAIEERLDTQRELGVAIPASAVVRAVAQSLPEGAVLERIGLDYANVQGTNKKIRRGAKDETPARELRGEIAGIAANESDVGRIVDGLAALAPMSQVSLESSRSREFNGRNVREFRIDFRVDLEKRWKLPEVVRAAEQGDTP